MNKIKFPNQQALLDTVLYEFTNFRRAHRLVAANLNVC